MAKRTWEEMKFQRGDPAGTREFREEVAALEFGRLMRQLRNDAQLSQTGLSKRLGISQAEVARIEAGSSMPSVITLLRTADAFDRHVVVTSFRGSRTNQKWRLDSPQQASEIVKEIRTGRGMSQNDLAETLGVRQANVARMEDRDSVPRVQTLARVARAVGDVLVVGLVHGERFRDSSKVRL